MPRRRDAAGPGASSGASAWTCCTPRRREAGGGEAVEVGGVRSDAGADVRVYDFGAVAVTLSLPLDGTAADLVELARTLDADESVEAAARGLATAVLDRLRAAVVRLEVLVWIVIVLIFVSIVLPFGVTTKP